MVAKAESLTCFLCGAHFESRGELDRHDCSGIVGGAHSPRRAFWTPTTLYVVAGALICLAGPLLYWTAGFDSSLPWWGLAGLFFLTGVLLLVTRSQEPVEEWLERINPLTRTLDDPRVRRREALVSFAFGIVAVLTALATGMGLIT